LRLSIAAKLYLLNFQFFWAFLTGERVERRLAAILAADAEGTEKRLRLMLCSSSWARTNFNLV
jgi:hypothetical protein